MNIFDNFLNGVKTMNKFVGYLIMGDDNSTFMYDDDMESCSNRCSVCGELLERPIINPEFIIKKKLDVSFTYDSYFVVSQKFLNEWNRLKGTGLNFTSIPNSKGFYVISANQIVEYDLIKSNVQFIKFMSCCQKYREVIGPMPAYIKHSKKLSEFDAVRSDLSFGSYDRKHPMIIVSERMGLMLKRAKLKGLNLYKVYSVSSELLPKEDDC